LGFLLAERRDDTILRDLLEGDGVSALLCHGPEEQQELTHAIDGPGSFLFTLALAVVVVVVVIIIVVVVVFLLFSPFGVESYKLLA
jgi:hypothetical protein